MKKYFLSICAIIKDEALYLPEWIEFHLLQGVEHFYLFLNDCSDGTLNICIEYAKLGLVTMISWPGTSTKERSIQLTAYDYFMKHYGRDSEWVACIDCDEFLYSKGGLLPQEIKDGNPLASAHLVHWVFYGSNGHKDYSPELLLKRFTRRAATADHHVKTILKPAAYISTLKNVHRFEIHGNTYEELEWPVPHNSPWISSGDEDKISLNVPIIAHFHTKSKEEYRKRCLRGRADWPIPKSFEENFPAHDKNEVEDTWLRDNFAQKIKDNLNKRPWNQI